MSELKKAVCRVIPDNATIAGLTWYGIRERIDCPKPKQRCVRIDNNTKLCLIKDNEK